MIYTEHRQYYQFEIDNANLLIAIENKPGGKCFRPSLCRVYYSSSFANRRRIFCLRSCILAVSELYWRCDSKRTPDPTYRLVSKSPFCIISCQEEGIQSCFLCWLLLWLSRYIQLQQSRKKNQGSPLCCEKKEERRRRRREEERRMMDGGCCFVL